MTQQHIIGSHKTTISTFDSYTHIIYWNTPVVKFNSTEIILNSGGFRTNTTKTRMNQTSNQFNLGFTVFQKNFNWYITYKQKTIEFYDNIKLKR